MSRDRTPRAWPIARSPGSAGLSALPDRLAPGLVRQVNDLAAPHVPSVLHSAAPPPLETSSTSASRRTPLDSLTSPADDTAFLPDSSTTGSLIRNSVNGTGTHCAGRPLVPLARAEAVCYYLEGFFPTARPAQVNGFTAEGGCTVFLTGGTGCSALWSGRDKDFERAREVFDGASRNVRPTRISDRSVLK